MLQVCCSVSDPSQFTPSAALGQLRVLFCMPVLQGREHMVNGPQVDQSPAGNEEHQYK